MSEQGGYLNERDLLDEMTSAMYLSQATGKYDNPGTCLGDIIDCQPNLTLRILQGAALAALNVMRRRQCLSDIGVEQVRKSSARLLEFPDQTEQQTTSP